MPRLPKGMFRRGRAFYLRDRRRGGDSWVRLADDYTEALNRFQEFKREGVPRPTPRVTVAEMAERWLTTRVSTGRGEKDQRTARARVEKYLEPFMGHLLLTKVTGDDLRHYRLWLEKQPIATATVAHILTDARCLFHWCEDSGYLERSPVPRRLLPRLQERPPDRLTDDELAKVLGIPEPWAFVVRLAVGTGLRWGELTRAQAKDVEDGMLVVSQTKSGKLRRVPVPPDLLRELKTHVGRLVPFATSSPGSFAKAVRLHSGVTRFHVHQLRHTYACGWLERGGSLAALQQILGHASVLTTQRYAKLSDDLVKREAARIASRRAAS